MLFTIAIPTYNGADKLGRAIESAVNQSYKGEYEILVVDNNSSDNTQEVIHSFSDKRIRVIRNQETVDMASNHNICFKEAKGDYIVICHTDDMLMPDALTILDDELGRLHYPTRIIAWGRSVLRDKYKEIRPLGHNLNMVFCGEGAGRAFMDWTIPAAGTCYSRKAIIELGLFPPQQIKIDPFEFYMMIVASYNYFEFIMIDRLYYLRIDASTAVTTLTSDDWFGPTMRNLDLIYNKLNPLQRRAFISDLYMHARIYHYPFIKNHLSGTLKIKFLIKAYLKCGIRGTRGFIKYALKNKGQFTPRQLIDYQLVVPLSKRCFLIPLSAYSYRNIICSRFYMNNSVKSNGAAYTCAA